MRMKLRVNENEKILVFSKYGECEFANLLWTEILRSANKTLTKSAFL